MWKNLYGLQMIYDKGVWNNRFFLELANLWPPPHFFMQRYIPPLQDVYNNEQPPTSSILLSRS